MSAANGNSLHSLVVRLSDSVTIIRGDCLGVLPVECNAVVTDPPYNIGKAAWDKIPDYLQWCESWIAAASKGCKRQGAFWCFHSEPDVLVDLSRMIARNGRPRQNWVTWDKDKWTYCRKYKDAGSRRFIESCEYIVYHADDGQWKDDWTRYTPIWDALNDARKGATVADIAARSGLPATQVSHYFQRNSSGWRMPTQAQADAMGIAVDCAELESMRDKAQAEYEHLRPTFNNPGKVSSVWQYPPAKANGHATPKPVELMQRIVETTTNPGDTVLDCFMGSGTTGLACIRTGRRFVGVEKGDREFEIARQRLENELQQGLLPLTHNPKNMPPPGRHDSPVQD